MLIFSLIKERNNHPSKKSQWKRDHNFMHQAPMLLWHSIRCKLYLTAVYDIPSCLSKRFLLCFNLRRLLTVNCLEFSVVICLHSPIVAGDDIPFEFSNAGVIRVTLPPKPPNILEIFLIFNTKVWSLDPLTRRHALTIK